MISTTSVLLFYNLLLFSRKLSTKILKFQKKIKTKCPKNFDKIYDKKPLSKFCLLTSPLLPILFSFCRLLQNQTLTVSLSISSSSASCEISALVGRELRKNAISNATK
jgi:hypothetical protein